MCLSLHTWGTHFSSLGDVAEEQIRSGESSRFFGGQCLALVGECVQDVAHMLLNVLENAHLWLAYHEAKRELCYNIMSLEIFVQFMIFVQACA